MLYAGNFGYFLANLSTVLRFQFSENANLFKEIKGWPQGIGIQFMPLVGETFGLLNEPEFFSPLISLAGFTLKDKGELRISLGYGLRGGVSKDIHFVSIRPDKDEMQIRMEFPQRLRSVDLKKINETGTGEDQFNDVSILFFIGHDFLPSLHSFYSGFDSVCKRILELSKELGHDLYFEIQSLNLRENTWAATQLCEHSWERVPKPNGKSILEVDIFGSVIGSGVFEFDDFLHLPIRLSDIHQFISNPDRENVRENELKITENPDSLVLSDHFNPFSIGALLRARAFVEYASAHRKPPSSHTEGCLREAGKMVLFSKEKDGGPLIRLLKNRGNKKIKVWANEYDNEGGIVLG